jgi:hypothetical protein
VDHTLQLHQRIFVALRRHDPREARQRMAEHLMDAKALLLRAHDQHQSSRFQNRITEITTQPAPLPKARRPAKKT